MSSRKNIAYIAILGKGNGDARNNFPMLMTDLMNSGQKLQPCYIMLCTLSMHTSERRWVFARINKVGHHFDEPERDCSEENKYTTSSQCRPCNIFLRMVILKIL
jgi:hypothetical protein